MLEIPGISAPFAERKRRLEQVRYSLEALARETGLHSADLARRAADFGAHFFLSHHPFVVPEPATVEPTESYSQADLEAHAVLFARLAEEARTQPELIRAAPHRAAIHHMPDLTPLEDPQRWAITWRAYRRKIEAIFS
jgi:glycine dehydrogenase subunit 2